MAESDCLGGRFGGGGADCVKGGASAGESLGTNHLARQLGAGAKAKAKAKVCSSSASSAVAWAPVL